MTKKPFRILDLGSHDGYVTLWIARQLREKGIEVRVDGIDLMPDAVKIAKRRFKDEGFKGTFKQGDALKPGDYFKGKYDAVVAFELIEHVVDPADLLDPCESMLAPGGRVYISTPDGCFGTGNNPHHLHAYRAQDLADILRRRGKLENMMVGSDGVTVGSYSPHPRLGDIAIYTGPGWEQWSPRDIDIKGLGGSETAAVRVAEQLSELGYIVTVYGDVVEGQCYRDVIFKHYSTFDPMVRRTAVISSRLPELFDRKLNTRCRMLWFHDVDAGPRLTPKRMEQIDHVLLLSQWHVQHFKATYGFGWDKLRQIRNGIELSYFKREAPERRKRVVYTSSPDRGLDVLLEMWPQVLEQVPDAELRHCYVDVYDRVAEVDPTIAKFRERVKELSDQPGVESVGHLSQPEVADLMRSAMVWAHPSWSTPTEGPFHETSCISPDTLIDMPRDYRTHPDGVPIKDLEGRSGFPVYAWNEREHRFTLATANACWKSRENAETIEIETEEGTTLTCTPDHKVLTFDGDWVEASTLKPGDRLRGLNYRFQVNVNLGDGKWTGEHRMVGEWMEGRKLESNEHVHHFDETRLEREKWLSDRATLAAASRREKVAQMSPEDQEAESRKMAERGRKGSRSWWDTFRALPEGEQQEWLTARANKIAASKREKKEAVANHRVKAIRPGPTVDVYDMEVEDHHNFVAGGVVVHNCIGAMEAQMAGCLPVAARVGALSETVKIGRLIEGEHLSDRWREVFVAMIVEGLTNTDVQEWAQKEGPEHAQTLGWDGVARHLQGLIDGEAPAFRS